MRTQSVDTRPEVERVLIEMIRKAPITKRFGFVQAWSASLIEAGVQSIQFAHPDVDETEARLRYAERHHGKECMDEVRSAVQERQVTIAAIPDFQAALMPIVEMLEQHTIAYALSGSVARSLYGMQRASFQIDVMADCDKQLLVAFSEQCEASYLLCQDVAQTSMPRQTAFTLMHLPSLLPIVVTLPHLSYEQEMLSRVQPLVLITGSRPVRVIAPEDAVLLALRDYHEDGEVADDIWLDLLGVLKVQGNNLDLPLLASWAEKLQVGDLLRQALIDAGLRETSSKEYEKARK
ncbi:MAG: hypothetical protein WCD86_03030 [Ktedonobacteraceae bacterium]